MKAQLGIALVVVICAASVVVNAQQPPTDVQVYEAFRTWVSTQAATLPRTEAAAQQVEMTNAYRKVLANQGVAGPEIDRRIRIITERGRRLEIDRWNAILTSATPAFNVQPNAFLTHAIKGVRPGSALDYGMGQGRNALYLAQQGWTVTGFDPAEKAVAAAQDQAGKLGVKLTTFAVGDDQFDFGKDRWDLIVLSYVGFRATMPRIYESLKPGGLVIVEAFHRDALKNGSIGLGVVFDSNELLKIFERFRVLQYEDTEDKADFGPGDTRVVRLVAQKM